MIIAVAVAGAGNSGSSSGLPAAAAAAVGGGMTMIMTIVRRREIAMPLTTPRMRLTLVTMMISRLTTSRPRRLARPWSTCCPVRRMPHLFGKPVL